MNLPESVAELMRQVGHRCSRFDEIELRGQCVAHRVGMDPRKRLNPGKQFILKVEFENNENF